MNRQDKTELDIILQRAGYVLIGCSITALATLTFLIFTL